MDKIEVSQRARDFAADYLDKNGQIAGNSAENIKAGLWDETRHIMDVARFERDILATRTEATPVATDVAALVEAAKEAADTITNLRAEQSSFYAKGWNDAMAAAAELNTAELAELQQTNAEQADAR